MRSDVLNCQFSMMDLMSQSFTHKAALWTLYGKADMAALASQLLLHLDLTQADGLNSYSGEATCQAICNIALRLTELVSTMLLDLKVTVGIVGFFAEYLFKEFKQMNLVIQKISPLKDVK